MPDIEEANAAVIQTICAELSAIARQQGIYLSPSKLRREAAKGWDVFESAKRRGVDIGNLGDERREQMLRIFAQMTAHAAGVSHRARRGFTPVNPSKPF